MPDSLQAVIALLLTLVLLALMVALIFKRDFRDAVLGGTGEANIRDFLKLKGASIVLLCGLLIWSVVQLTPDLPSGGAARPGPIPVRLNVHFEPNDVNPRNEHFSAKAFIKTPEGNRPVKIVHTVAEGALSVHVDVPDMETPFFIVFDTPKGIWITDDFSVKESAATARKQGQ